MVLCNVSLSEGTFPSQLKIGKVKPLLKHGNSTDTTTYRPISIVTGFAKVLEVMLSYFLSKSTILSNYHNGFRKKMPIFTPQDYVTSALNGVDGQSKTLPLFLAFNKASVVKHHILLSKLLSGLVLPFM